MHTTTRLRKILWEIPALLALGIVLAGVLILATPPGEAGQAKPAELKIGVVSFLSGPATVFGVPSKNAAEWLIEKYNREGGIGGVKIRPVYIDQAGGAPQPGGGGRPARARAHTGP